MEEFWAVFWMAIILKIPIGALLLLVWYAIQSPPVAEQEGPGGGGSDRDPHRGGPRHPRPPRRGPHADPLPQPPSRVRAASAQRTPTA